MSGVVVLGVDHVLHHMWPLQQEHGEWRVAVPQM